MAKKLFLVLFIIGFIYTGLCQNFVLQASESKLNVTGSSTIHDWEMHAEKLEGSLTTDTGNEQIPNITALQLLIEAQSLRGEKEGMNEDAHEALKTNRYKYIQYDLQNTRELQCDSISCSGAIEGYLTVAGNRKPVTVSFQAVIDSNRIRLSGIKELEMTYFNIRPPKTFLGLIKADNKIKVDFDFVFRKEE